MTEYVYSLTRICLRSGELTLPGTMLDVFPDEGTVVAVDTALDRELPLEIRGPRRVGGLGPFMENHELGVNDRIVIRPLEDGRFALTPAPRDERAGAGARALAAHLKQVVTLLETGGRPMTPAEIRAALPHLPQDLDLARRLADDPRVRLAQGRWRAVELEEALDQAAAHETTTDAAPASSRGADVGATHADGLDAAAAGAPGGADPAQEPAPSAPEPARAPTVEAAAARPRRDAEASPLFADDGDGPELAPSDPDPLPVDGSVRVTRAPSAASYPSGLKFPGAHADRGPESGELAALGRVREALVSLGYEVESLGSGLLTARADLGRRSYQVLIHPLPDEQRLEWAPLLSRRRDTGARYLAVFGDHRDLARLQAPADLARATLWSWAGLDRVLDLADTVLISPVDLEPHFERDGMFDAGLARFERAIGKRVDERGAFSTMIARLSTMRAPAVFLLDDIVTDAEISRETVLELLERLEHAPFHLVSRVGSGEFCLRYRVSDALLHLSQYALSLREQLPNRRRERVVGSASPEAEAAELPTTDAPPAAGGASDADAASAVRSAASTAAPAEDAVAEAVPVPAGRSARATNDD